MQYRQALPGCQRWNAVSGLCEYCTAGGNRRLTKEMRTQLLDAAEHYANGEYMLSPMPGHWAYVKRAA